MGESAALLHGIVRNGVIVPLTELDLPDGTEIAFSIQPSETIVAGVDTPLEFTPEERAEFDQWQKLGAEAWAMIDEWEAEDDAHEAG